jgi:nucleoid-associated protein Lsr2
VASKTVVELFDDLDGGRADETVSFALDGVDYEIDLSTAHATVLREILGEYVAKAHKTPARPRRNRKVAPPARPNAGMTAEIRRLASESARKVSEAQQVAEPPEPLPAATVNAGPRAERRDGTEPVHALVIPFQEAGL